MAEQEVEETTEAPVKKSKKKLFMLIGLVLVLLGGGGGAAWYFMHGKTEGEGHDAKEEKVEPEKPPVFIRLETFTVNLQPAEDGRYLQVDIVLQVDDEHHAEVFNTYMPEVRSRLIQLLSSKEAEELTIPDEGHKNLISEIIEVLDEPFTKNGKPQEIKHVSFTSFIIQ